ncbi:MAG: DUF6390 family protein [Armatimonadota bacterium]|nr:DUF6390 family protein [Armatimonadota bacterium]MDW8155568.1 DUF6390 family protein [Armatimonadota bacterium]
MSREGALLAARFGFMPNRLGYCGPDENRALLDYLSSGTWDRGLEEILSRFAAAFPYYRFIAAVNGIPDVLDHRVVEAYWIGNELIERVDVADFCRYLEEQFGKRFARPQLHHLLGWLPEGARPHHTFHVLAVPARTPAGALPCTVEVADQCRVAWGRVLAVDGASLLVERHPLLLRGGRLELGPPEVARAFWRFDGKALLDRVGVGDVVALHWGCACVKLTGRQLRWLRRLTHLHIHLLNRHLGHAPLGAYG